MKQGGLSSRVLECVNMDDAVRALHLLIGDTAERRREIAEVIGANEQSLYQIVRGIPLSSGKKRTVGRELREKLDAHFPGWRTGALLAPHAQATATLGTALTASPTLRDPAEGQALTERHRALLGLFDGLTVTQQEAFMKELAAQKERNDELMAELLARRRSGA